MKLCGDTKTIKERLCICLCFPTVHLSKLAFKLTGTDTILVGEVFLHINSFFFFHDIVQSLVTHDNGIQNSKRIILEMILFQERKSLSRCDGHVTVCGLQLSGKDL